MTSGLYWASCSAKVSKTTKTHALQQSRKGLGKQLANKQILAAKCVKQFNVAKAKNDDVETVKNKFLKRIIRSHEEGDLRGTGDQFVTILYALEEVVNALDANSGQHEFLKALSSKFGQLSSNMVTKQEPNIDSNTYSEIARIIKDLKSFSAPS